MTPDAFIEEFLEKLTSAKLSRVAVVELSRASDKMVSLDKIQVANAYRGKRYGSLALKLLMALADEAQMILETIPRRLGASGLSDNQLEAMYARRGFVRLQPDSEDRLMRRLPAGHRAS